MEVSAFTYYLLQGLGPDWNEVDGDHDGVILYGDLQVYVGNKLVEEFRNKGIVGSMNPQLFAQSQKIWAAYQTTKALNRDTQQIRSLKLERTIKVQNPEKVADMLPKVLPPGAHSYLKALRAINDRRYDEAWKLLDKADLEEKVAAAEILWARAYAKFLQGELRSAADLLDRALKLGQQQNVDLLEMTAFSNFGIGNWVRAEEQFKQLLELLRDDRGDRPETIDSLMALAFIHTSPR
jgi:tetratricopeptide (TPR) repeat protein